MSSINRKPASLALVYVRLRTSAMGSFAARQVSHERYVEAPPAGM